MDFHDIHKYFRLADFAINPVKPVHSKRYCTSIKDGEYWVMGLPVIIPENISDDSDIIKENNIGAILPELNEDEYLKAIKKIDNILNKNRSSLNNRIRKIAIQYRRYEIAEEIYMN